MRTGNRAKIFTHSYRYNIICMYVRINAFLIFITLHITLLSLVSMIVPQMESLNEISRSPLHPRRASSSTSSRNGPIPLVTKIFQVLDYWQDVHFEVTIADC